MKLTFLFAVILLNGTGHSQSIQEFTNQFLVDSHGRVHLKHNVELEYFMNFDDTSYLGTEESDIVFNDHSDFPKRYYEKKIIKFSEEKKVRIDIIMDTIILFEESFNDKIIRRGKVKIATTYSTYDIMVSNMYGEDSLVTDTFYHFVPIEKWINDLDGVHFEEGSFQNGEKEGLWQVKLWLGISHCLGAVLTEQQFANGSLISEKTIGYHKPSDEITKSLLVKEWFGTGRYLSNEEPFIVSFTTTKNKCGNRPGQFDYLLFNNKTFIEKGYYYCRVGGVPKSISGKWSIKPNGKLILDEYPFSVEYISETELLLENKN